MEPETKAITIQERPDQVGAPGADLIQPTTVVLWRARWFRQALGVALMLTLLGVLVVILLQFGLPRSGPAKLTLVGARAEDVAALWGQLDVRTRFHHQDCRAWSGYLEGYPVAIAVVGTDRQTAETCMAWLLQSIPTQAVVVIDKTPAAAGAAELVIAEPVHAGEQAYLPDGRLTTALWSAAQALSASPVVSRTAVQVLGDTRSAVVNQPHAVDTVGVDLAEADAAIIQAAQDHNLPWAVVRCLNEPAEKAASPVIQEALRALFTPEPTAEK